MSKSKEIKFQIKGVELLSFHLMPLIKELNSEDIEFKVQIEHKLDAEQNQVNVISTISFVKKESDKLAEIIVSCLFLVENLEKISSLKKNKDKLSFMNDAINSISISTTRGVLASATRGTYLHNIILPIINPRMLEPS